MDAPAKGTVAARYAELSIDRQPFLDRARECALLTIPSILPKEDIKNQKLVVPYQGVGSRGVGNLAAKLLLGLFPPNVPFLRLSIDDFALEELAQNPDARGEAEKALNKYERAVMLDVETTALRVPIHTALKHLIVTGNILLFRDPDTGKARAIPLSSYVCRRDPLGTVLEIIVKEEIAFEVLPETIRAAIKAKLGDRDDPKTVAIYTRIKREARRWAVDQESGDHKIEEASGSYPLDLCPWLPLRMIPVDGEDYGRSFVEEHYSDLNTLELLTKALVQFSAAAAKVVFGVRPNSTTKAKALSEAKSGDIITGDLEKDVTILQMEKYADFQVAQKTAQQIEDRLSYAFMLNSAIQRNGERVTAEEIRRLAQELDTSLGGVHALLAQELQLPLAKLIMAAKVKRKELPKLPSGLVKPMIVTGVEALGRGSDLENLSIFGERFGMIPGAVDRIKVDEWGKRIGAAVGVSTDGLFKTDQEIAQEQQQALMAEMAAKAAPQVANNATKAMAA